MLKLHQLKSNKVTQKPNTLESSSDSLEDDDIVILDENFKPPIEKAEEVTILTKNDEWIYVYNPDSITYAFAKVFDLDFVGYDPPPSKEMGRKIENVKNGTDLSYRMIFKNSNNLTYIEQGVAAEFVDLETENGKVSISAWPVKRKIYTVSSGREEEIDLLDLFSKYPGFVDSKEAIKRIDDYFITEWKKIHGSEKQEYIR